MLDRATPATCRVSTGDLVCLYDCGSCSRGVDLLCGRFGRGSEWCVVGDAVPVAVSGDDSCGLALGCRSASVVGFGDYADARAHLDDALGLLANCADIYTRCDDTNRRLCNQSNDQNLWMALGEVT